MSFNVSCSSWQPAGVSLFCCRKHRQPAGVSLLHYLMAFVCLSMYLSTRLSSCAKPLSGRLSWALLSPCSPRPRIVCRSLAYTVAIALSSCFFAFVLSVSCNTRCLEDIDQTLLSRLLCGDFRTSSCAYSLKVHSSGKPVTNIRVPKISFVSEMIGQYFLISIPDQI